MTGHNGDSTDPTTWGTFEQALERARRDKLSGIGFVFSDSDPFCGIDLDNCRDLESGTLEPWAERIIADLRSYTEISPSGRGVHIIIKARKPGDRCKTAYQTGKVEIYNHAKYFTFSGNHLPGTPKEICDRQAELERLYFEVFPSQPAPQPAQPAPRPGNGRLSDEELIRAMLRSASGPKIERLLDGDTSAYPSQSEADFALCSHLAWWSNGDAEQIDRIFRASKLYREKWERADYRTNTIGKAIQSVQGGYHVGGYAPTKPVTLPHKLGARLPSSVAEQVKAMTTDSPAPDLRKAVMAALLEHNKDNSKKLRPVLLRRQKAGELVLTWLRERGDFCQSETGEVYYFDRHERQLYALDSTRWGAYLYVLTGVNPASTDYAFIATDCKTAATFAKRRKVLRVAAWDDDAQVLRVSRFDGTVYRLDGQSVTEEANGESVLFADDPLWLPYTPDYTARGAALHWATKELPNWNDDRNDPDGDVRGLAFRSWVLSTFFTELCPSRPLCVFLGEKGSGKSMALRILLQLLFGPTAQLNGIPDKPDGFTAMAGASHVFVLDNLDDFTPWLRDKLARLASGAEDTYRKLYTSNEVGRVIYRCWVGFTSRTPDTLRRDDLADRLLILPVKRLEDTARKCERSFYDQAASLRNAWWGDVLTACNQAVASIRSGGLNQSVSRLRLADWESLGRIFAYNEGCEPLWDTFCQSLQVAQADFLLEGEPIVEALTAWLQNPNNQGRQITSRDLYGELTALLYPNGKKPDNDWPKTAKGFGKKLGQIKRDLAKLFGVVWEDDRGTKLVYQFWDRGRGPKTPAGLQV